MDLVDIQVAADGFQAGGLLEQGGVDGDERGEGAGLGEGGGLGHLRDGLQVFLGALHLAGGVVELDAQQLEGRIVGQAAVHPPRDDEGEQKGARHEEEEPFLEELFHGAKRLVRVSRLRSPSRR